MVSSFFLFNISTFAMKHKSVPNTWWDQTVPKHQSLEERNVSVQFCLSDVSNSLWPHGLQHAGPPCPLLSPGFCPSLLSVWIRVNKEFKAVHLNGHLAFKGLKTLWEASKENNSNHPILINWGWQQRNRGYDQGKIYENYDISQELSLHWLSLDKRCLMWYVQLPSPDKEWQCQSQIKQVMFFSLQMET